MHLNLLRHGAGVLTCIAAGRGARRHLVGFPTDEGLLEPEVDIVSFYIDQFPENDIGRAVAAENGIEIYSSIKGALCLGGATCAVDGVICIGEHGEYAMNEKGQAMFPRRYFFEQICGVIAASIQAGGQPIPVYTDKHLAYNWSVSAVDAVANATSRPGFNSKVPNFILNWILVKNPLCLHWNRRYFLGR